MENDTPRSTHAKTDAAASPAGEKARFGKTQDPLLWIERGKLLEVARSLRNDAELSFDFLEHLTVMTMDDLLVATYFVRSFAKPSRQIVLRTTVASGPNATLPSVQAIWPTAAPIEIEVGGRFGIRFETEVEMELGASD